MSSLSLLFSVFSLFLPHLSPVYITHAAASTMAAELTSLLKRLLAEKHAVASSVWDLSHHAIERV